jgi:hypothetical protein
MPLNGTDSKAGCAKSAQMGGKRSCLVVVRWELGGGLMANFGSRAGLTRRIRPLSLTKTHLATGIIVPFPYIRPAGRNIDIAEFVLVLVLAGSALAGTMIMLICCLR